MTEKLEFNISAETQSVESVRALLRFLNKLAEPLPELVSLTDGVQLTRSSKGDCYYYTSPKGCTCPGYFYRHSCKHIKSLANASSKHQGQTLAETLKEADKNLYRMPKNYQRMVRAAREDAEAEPLESIHKGGFRPVLPDEEV